MENEDSPKFKNEKIKKSTALMLENQFNWLSKQGFRMDEALSDPGTSQYAGSLGGSGYADNGFFHKIAIPMVRRTFPELVAHELVGVQPLNGPVGLAFAMRFIADQAYDGSSRTEVGYNTIDSAYTGSHVTSTGEALGSASDSELNTTSSNADLGLGYGDGTSIKELSMTLEKDQVEAKTRKLRSR